ncbi:MAG: hypothetical protein M0Q93_10205 [Terrimicrobiaceae bacterium]|nr:hypothetical protein [Terrimicrobiaceae bacterium]
MPHEKFKGGIGNGEVETLLAEAGQFLGNGETADFAPGVRGKRLEDDFFVEVPDEFRAEKPPCSACASTPRW